MPRVNSLIYSPQTEKKRPDIQNPHIHSLDLEMSDRSLESLLTGKTKQKSKKYYFISQQDMNQLSMSNQYKTSYPIAMLPQPRLLQQQKR